MFKVTTWPGGTHNTTRFTISNGVVSFEIGCLDEKIHVEFTRHDHHDPAEVYFILSREDAITLFDTLSKFSREVHANFEDGS